MCIALITALLLHGCSSIQDVSPKVTDFKCKGTAHLDDYQSDFEMSVHSGGIFIISITSPSTVNGLTFRWNGDNATITYNNMESNLLADKTKANCFADTLHHTFNDLLKQNHTVNGNIAEGYISEGEYTVIFRADGFPCEIKIPSINLVVSLDDFEYM